MELRLLDDLETIPATDWNRLAGDRNPFLRHEFLTALQRHGAASERTGWSPRHLALFDGPRPVAAAPGYLKSHSWGEFVFDFAWADAYSRHGRRYYPKLVSAVPYTPATGPRLLAAPGADPDRLRRALAEGARAATEELDLSTAHWLFPLPSETDLLAESGYLVRQGCQYHWYNPGYTGFDEFLGGLSSKKRKNIRRERRQVVEAGIRLRTVHGDEADDALWRHMHRFYRRTFHAYGNIPVLSLDFFREIGRTMGSRVVLLVAEHRGRVIAGAICLRGSDTLYGRYWGCDEEHDGLHFETCYYQGIEYCIREGLQRFEPGAQGEHKVARGFLPTRTYSCHYIADDMFRQAIGDFLGRERRAVDEYIRTLTMEGPYRPEALERIVAMESGPGRRGRRPGSTVAADG